MPSDDLADQFVAYVGESVQDLRSIVDGLNGGPVDTAARDRMYDHAHNIKGMGSSFQFDLMTDIGASLCAYLKKPDAPDTLTSRALDGHVRALEVVLENRIMGKGGEKGAALIARLEELTSA